MLQSAKYEFASSNTTRTTFAFDACFVWELAPPSASSGRTNRLFHRKSIATIDVFEHVLDVANSYLAYRRLSVCTSMTVRS
jgi:hypothetical protein